MLKVSNPAKRLRLREARVHFGLFDYSFTCIAGPRDGVAEYIGWKFDGMAPAEMGELARGQFFHRHGYAPVIWIPRPPVTPTEIGTLVHEITHVVRVLMEWAAIQWTYDTDEVVCYAIAHGVRETMTQLKRK